jgi:molybdate transport system substrate-binding protein
VKHLVLAAAAFFLAASHGAGASAGEITLIAPGGIRSPLEALVPAFEQKTGNTVAMTFGSGGKTRDQVVDGAPYDVPIVEAPLDRVITSGHVVVRSATPLANAAVGIALRPGKPKPRITTREDVRFLLLSAGAISVPDAANGAAAGESFAETLDVLGLADRVGPLLRVAPNGVAAMTMLAHGDVDVGVTFISEMIGVPGIEIVGKLPPEFSPRTRFVAFVSATAHDPDAAKALVAYLAAQAAAAAYTSHGMEPVHAGEQ